MNPVSVIHRFSFVPCDYYVCCCYDPDESVGSYYSVFQLVPTGLSYQPFTSLFRFATSNFSELENYFDSF